MHLGGEASMQKVIVASVESSDTQNIINIILLYHDCSSYDNNYDLDSVLGTCCCCDSASTGSFLHRSLSD